ncbi:MAG: DUF4199 domain-containing protein [Flavobacterium sp.]
MKNYSIEIKWAIRFTLLVLTWSIAEKLTGLHDAYISKYWLYSNLFAIPAVIFYFLALNEKKKYFFNGNITWQQGFVSGVVLSFLIALLNPFAQYVIYSSITPHFFENIIEYKLKNTRISAQSLQAVFNLTTQILQTTFGSLSMGIITGALVSLFIKTK